MSFQNSDFRFRCLWLLAVFLVVAEIGLAQTPASPDKPSANSSSRLKGSITGRIISDDGQPAGGAGVMAVPVNGKLQAIQKAHCDADGNFKLTNLGDPAYFLFTEVPGFVLEQGALETPHRLGENVTLSLTKGGIITGRVTDSTGEPLVAARVFARRVRGLGGEAEDPNAMLRLDSRGNSRLTDDRGVYRIFGLAAGVYVIYVQANGTYAPGVTVGNEAPTYHPSSAREAATEVIIPAGTEVSGIDIRHRADRGHIISGTVAGSLENSQVMIPLRNLASGQIESYTYFNGSSGFAFYAVPDGEYEMTALQPSFREIGNEQGLSASLPRRVTVRGANVAGLELKMARLGAISGHVVIEKQPPNACPSPPASAPTRVESVLMRASEDQPESQPLRLGLGIAIFGETIGEATPGAGGEFRLPNLQAGRYRIEANLPNETLYLRSITQPTAAVGKKIDAARSPISLKQSEKLTGVEITVTEGAAALAGRVVAGEGQKLPKRLLVHLTPVEATAADDVLRYREAAANEDGAFAFQHLAPGKYWLLVRAGVETEAKKTAPRPAAFDASERAKLRREAEAAKNEIMLQPCQRAKDVTARFAVAQ